RLTLSISTRPSLLTATEPAIEVRIDGQVKFGPILTAGGFGLGSFLVGHAEIPKRDDEEILSENGQEDFPKDYRNPNGSVAVSREGRVESGKVGRTGSVAVRDEVGWEVHQPTR
ncbi:hypothetical protein, partial [Chromobacterium piscinae]